MKKSAESLSVGDWDGVTIAPSESRDVKLAIGESYSSMTVRIPIHVRRGPTDGPVIFVTAAIHGDEINGTGAVRNLIDDDTIQLKRGSLILVPVVNLLAFDRHSRYLPDRRDLNRSFPGSTSGSLASRMARNIFDKIVLRSDFGIDLHTASVRRTNYPNVRGDLSNRHIKQMVKAFGCDIVMDGKGPRKSFRREATIAGCPTIIMEGGEVWKVEPTIVETAVRGVKNVLRSFDMLDGEIETADHQVVVKRSAWVRAEQGGFLHFHVNPGSFVEKGQPLATNTTLLGKERNTLHAPFDAVVIGMTTLPAVSPGEPVCNLGKLPSGVKPSQYRRWRKEEDGLETQISKDLASNVLVVDHEENS